MDRKLRSGRIGSYVVAFTAAGIVFTTGACSAGPDYAEECVNTATNQAFPDQFCDQAPDTFDGDIHVVHTHPVYMWYYVPSSYRGARYYTVVRGGSFDSPRYYAGSRWGRTSNYTIYHVNIDGSTNKSSSRSSSTIQRGGFGPSSSKSSGSSTSSGRSTSGSSGS